MNPSGNILSKNEEAKNVIFFALKLVLIWLSWKVVFYITGEERVPVDEIIFPDLSFQWEKLNSAMRWLTAGESHGPALTAILEGMPSHIKVSSTDIDNELARRRLGPTLYRSAHPSIILPSLLDNLERAQSDL